MSITFFTVYIVQGHDIVCYLGSNVQKQWIELNIEEVHGVGRGKVIGNLHTHNQTPPCILAVPA
jgi:hypothetical protein